MKTIQQSSAYRARMSLLYEAVEDYLARIKFLIRFKKLEKRVEEIKALPRISAVHYTMLKEIMKRRKIRKEDECLEELIQQLYNSK